MQSQQFKQIYTSIKEYVYIHIYVHVHMYIYIYKYIHILTNIKEKESFVPCGGFPALSDTHLFIYLTFHMWMLTPHHNQGQHMINQSRYISSTSSVVREVNPEIYGQNKDTDFSHPFIINFPTASHELSTLCSLEPKA